MLITIQTWEEVISLIKMYQGTDNRFIDACKKADVKPTRRQYKKYQRKQGKAYEECRNTLKESA